MPKPKDERVFMTELTTLKDAVNAVIQCLGMMPYDGSADVPAGKKEHILKLIGIRLEVFLA